MSNSQAGASFSLDLVKALCAQEPFILDRESASFLLPEFERAPSVHSGKLISDSVQMQSGCTEEWLAASGEGS